MHDERFPVLRYAVWCLRFLSSFHTSSTWMRPAPCSYAPYPFNHRALATSAQRTRSASYGRPCSLAALIKRAAAPAALGDAVDVPPCVRNPVGRTPPARPLGSGTPSIRAGTIAHLILGATMVGRPRAVPLAARGETLAASGELCFVRGHGEEC
jgi:hypothetical protein